MPDLIILWKLWYSDGSVFSNLDGPPETAPGWGLLLAVNRSSDHGFDVVRGGNHGRHDDNYWWDHASATWFKGDDRGLADYLALPGWRKVIFGRSVANPVFDEIYQRAINDPDFPPKTGWRHGESTP